MPQSSMSASQKQMRQILCSRTCDQGARMFCLSQHSQHKETVVLLHQADDDTRKPRDKTPEYRILVTVNNASIFAVVIHCKAMSDVIESFLVRFPETRVIAANLRYVRYVNRNSIE